MRYIVASEEDIERIEGEPFNPPRHDGGITEDEFDDEWWKVRKNLKDRLSTRARPYVDVNDWGDFSLSESRGDSRWIYITFHTKKLWKHDFCAFIADFLRGLDEDYCIGCTTEANGLLGLIATPVIFLAITKDTVHGKPTR